MINAIGREDECRSSSTRWHKGLAEVLGESQDLTDLRPWGNIIQLSRLLYEEATTPGLKEFKQRVGNLVSGMLSENGC